MTSLKRRKVWRLFDCCLHSLARRPVLSAVCILGSITAIGSVLLHRIEPKTFVSFDDGLWFTYISLLGIGYGDIVPHTWQGRIVSAPLLLLGIVTVSVFMATVELFFLRPFLRIGPDNSALLKEILRLTELHESEQSAKQAELALMAEGQERLLKQQIVLANQLSRLGQLLEGLPEQSERPTSSSLKLKMMRRRARLKQGRRS